MGNNPLTVEQQIKLQIAANRDRDSLEELKAVFDWVMDKQAIMPVRHFEIIGGDKQ